MEKIVELKNINKNFENKKVLNNFSLILNKKEILGIEGRNGSGKSTILKIIAGILKEDSGEVYKHPQTKIELLLEGSRSFYWNITGRQNLQYFSSIFDIQHSKKKINELIKILHLESFVNELSGTYSRGMQQKLSLAISLLKNPNILLLDEPTNGLDKESVKELIELLEDMRGNLGVTLVLVSHDNNFLDALADRKITIY